MVRELFEHSRLHRAGFLLLLCALVLGLASLARAGEFCSDAPYFGKIDGSVLPTPPTQITIDTDCTFQNWPASNPLTTTVNFQTNDPSIYLIIFDNVTFTGNMACANINHRIWFSNGSDYGSGNACQDLFIPVETIAKENPAGQATAAIGVPFTYTLTLPSMSDVGGPSLNDLHTVILWDDLNATGADLTFVGLKAYEQGSGAPVTLIPEDDPAAKGGVWTPKNLSYKPLPLLPRGEQVVVELTVVLDDTPANAAGTSFVNTAKWWFGRLIEGQFYEPLPGEWGITAPLIIAEPGLVVTKSSQDTALNLGVPATFTLDVQNTGGGTAWNVTLLDRIPEGMCDFDPTTAPGGVSARIVSAAGTPVADLTPGTDFALTYDAGATSGCTLGLTLLTDQAGIAPDQHLRVTYQAQLDAHITSDGLALTNVAGATAWFSANNQSGRSYRRTLSDGTPALVDHQDSQTVTTALSGYYFQKTVENLTSGASPAMAAAPGDRLRYRLRLFNVDQTIEGITISDVLDPGSFEPTTFAMVTPPPGSTYGFDGGTGLLEVRGGSSPLTVAVGAELVLEFDITLHPALAHGTLVDNQATFSASGLTAASDDPWVNGIAAPGEPADPTRVTIQAPGPLAKANSQPVATIGEEFTYRITVPADPIAVPLYDVRILDDLAQANADLRFVGATVASGGNWNLSNSGSATDLVLGDPATGMDIPPGGQAVVELTVALENVPGNERGGLFQNRARYTYNRINGNPATQRIGGLGTTPDMRVIEPAIAATKALSYVLPAGKGATDPARVGDMLEYAVTLTNNGDADAFDAGVVDILPAGLALVPDSATARAGGLPVPGFVANPAVLPGGGLAWGPRNGDESLDLSPGQALVLTYRVTVVSVTGADMDNSVYVDWTSRDGASAAERTGDGCPSITSPDDYCFGPATVGIGTVDYTSLAKSVVDHSFAETPAGTTAPVVRVGDTVTYELTLNLQEYTTRGVAVEDALPEGLELKSFIINEGASFNYTLATPPAPGATGTLRWEFGDITNPPSGDGTPIDPLVIRYVATVVPDAPTVGVAYDLRMARVNRAQLSYAGGDPEDYPGRLTATATVEVRQPRMSAISKVDLGGGRVGSGSAADPYQVDISTDVMNFRLSSCNDGLAPAYDVVVTDLLAPQLDEGDLAANPPLVKIDSTLLGAGADYIYSAPGRGGELRIALLDSAPVNPGACVTVDYNLGFHTDLTASTTWSNLARLAEYRSLPLSDPGRRYASSGSAQVWMTNLVSADQLLTTLVSPAEATIGEEVVYQIKVPAAPMNVAQDAVGVTDILPGALEYVGASAVDSGGAPVTLTDNSVMPGQVDLGIAHIPAGGQAIITLRARVRNNDQANAGVRFANTASYTYAGASAATSSTSAPLTIVEPSVAIATRVANLSNPGTAPTAGDILRYSVSLSAGGGGGDNFSSAFDLSLVGSLSPGMAYRSGTAGVDGPGNTIADPAVTGDGSSTAQTLTWSPADAGADIDVVEGTVVTVTYEVVVQGGLLPGQELTNSVLARWTSLDGDNAFERTGSGTPVENDYVAGPAATSLRVALAIPFVKSVVNATTGADPGASAAPGDTLRYTLVLRNESVVPLTNAKVVDELAAPFAPGSLRVLSVSDAGADTTNTHASGGVSGTGMVDIRNLTLAAQGDPGDTLTIVFEATLVPVIRSGTTVVNRAHLSGDYQTAATSNEASTLVTSAPAFEVWKTSRDLTGDPTELTAGDTLRYTITVKNVGDENAEGAVLRDQVPANTTYVEGSTTLNGSPVADPSAGTSPLQGGLALNAPEEATAGALRADATATSANVATVTFDVVINGDVVDGAIIANQGLVNAAGAGSGPTPAEPTDDPDTPTIPDDPTLDVVGTVPLVDAYKTVEIVQPEIGSAGSVDPGDVLRYTIALTNLGTAPATGVIFTDAVPADTTYVPASVRLNGRVAGMPDGGISPLVSGIAVSSADLTAPPPGAEGGILSPGETAVITFDVRVNGGVAPGTVVSNQGVVHSHGLPDEATDADGIDINGDQPTRVVVGEAQQLSILKEVFVVGGGAAVAGSQLEYAIRVTNIGSLPATNVVVTDDLGPLTGRLSYVAGSGSLDQSAAGVSWAGSVLSADYAAHYGDLPAGADAVVRFRVRIDPAAASGTTLTNSAVVSWNDPALTEIAAVSLDVGGTPGSGNLNGWVWHDASLDQVFDASETPLHNWSVELYRGNQLLAAVPSDAGGAYSLSGLAPNGGAEPYELRFRAPGAGPNTPSLGTADSPFGNGPQRISGISVAAGGNLPGLNLPLTPNGSVYDSVLRLPIAGARLALVHAATNVPLPGPCFDDPAQQDQVTGLDGFYKFDLNFRDVSCPPGATYFIEVTPPASGYAPPPSQIIPPGDAPTAPFSVPACPASAADAVPATAEYCEVTGTSAVPPLSVAPRTDGTVYHLILTLSNGRVPGESQIFNNHIPVDPVLDGAVAITKTAALINVTKGQLVPYTITVNNLFGAPLFDLAVVDSFPAGFKYLEGSARLDGQAREPGMSGRELVWDGLALQVNDTHTLQLLLVVGAGVAEGEYVNRAQVLHTVGGGSVSGEATATVRVVPDPTFDCTDVLGKVFDDQNRNGDQDEGEPGLAGARVVTARGLIGTSDAHGRFHIDCAAVPDEDRGSNFILKLDDRSLPTGYRLTTENPRVQRATRGKALKFNFGATIHRVVAMDIADGAFEPGTTELRLQWRPRIEGLLAELVKGPAVLRLAYLADVEAEGLVRRRLKALKKAIAERWAGSQGGYRLDIETEVFWRRGGPP